MKKLFYLCLFLSFSNVSNAQVQDTAPWCPDGATWVYTQFGWGSYHNIYEYVEDTTILGFSVKKIRDRQIEVFFTSPQFTDFFRIQGDTNYLFLRESNDSIFIFSDGQFKFMYNFSAGLGDQFILNHFVDYRTCAANPPNFVDDTLTLTETNTNYIVGDLIFKKSSFTSSGRWGFSSLIDKIGPIENLYPVPTTSDCYSQIGYHGLQCYSDNLRGTIYFKDTTNQRFSCEYLISATLGIQNNLTLKPNPIVYPNPGVDLINIDIDIPFADLDIIDLNGRLVLSIKNTSLKGIDISSLSSGSYVIKVISNSNIYPIKFIKK
jgi:hypothetical protein